VRVQSETKLYKHHDEGEGRTTASIAIPNRPSSLRDAWHGERLGAVDVRCCCVRRFDIDGDVYKTVASISLLLCPGFVND
jgi:hypothetical protein